MPPSVESLLAVCPGLNRQSAQEHLSRLDESYFNRFDAMEICRHIECLERLRPDRFVELLFAHRSGAAELTVLSFDYPSVFSVISGILTASGFNIERGDIFTYSEYHYDTEPLHRRTRSVRSKPGIMARRRIVDCFIGRPDQLVSFEDWKRKVSDGCETIIRLLEKGDAESALEARQKVNERVAQRLTDLQTDRDPVLYPMSIEVDTESGPFTRLRVLSQDTPAFLYSLSNALSLAGVSIERVTICTENNRVEDTIDVADSRGNKITDPVALNQIRLSVLFTKQFTYFLAKAPDPYAALTRYEHLVEGALGQPKSGTWLKALSDPRVLKDLARLLGASDFLWEDFIRTQYETLIPMLDRSSTDHRFASPPDTVRNRIAQLTAAAPTVEEKRAVLNEFKDREIFLIDLDHILASRDDFGALAKRLTSLAEAVVLEAVDFTYANLVARFGEPQTVARLPARFAVVGLGKFGGCALGYASDIELLFIYDDAGTTGGASSITNAEFFECLVKETAQSIRAKREGIFIIDLQLRPHGKKGALACSLEQFCSYYGSGGQAHSYERLALVRMRAVAGDRALGLQVERLRDDMIYATNSITPQEIKDLREKQFREKSRPGSLNAKFSPGGLVDLEYDVQILQVIHGSAHRELRTPRLHEALEALANAGVLSTGEGERLAAAYNFLRRLINGLRMLRGSAQDLFLPDHDAAEFAHLARRMGYENEQGDSPSRQLKLDCDSHMAAVRAFVERHFGRDFLPAAAANAADLVMSDAISPQLYRTLLSESGFADPERAYVNIRSLAGDGPDRERFARLAILACDILRRGPDPDMALNNWERYAGVQPDRSAHYKRLLAQPRYAEILFGIFGASQFLADTLIGDPEFADWVIAPQRLHNTRSPAEARDDLALLSSHAGSHDEWLAALRRFRRREILRIGTRDICLRNPLASIAHDLSVVAETVIRHALSRILSDFVRSDRRDFIEKRFLCFALGKLGGGELNYSSDVDLLVLLDDQGGMPADETAEGKDLCRSVLDALISDLSIHTDQGYAYRVDVRLRPHGNAGSLAPSVTEALQYYRRDAELWEVQALLKLRPIFGPQESIGRVVADIQSLLLKNFTRRDIAASISAMRGKMVKKLSARPSAGIDVKERAGGIRDIEFFVQGHQLFHASGRPELLDGNTLSSLEKLVAYGIVNRETADSLRDDYLLLRQVEHYLQLYDDRQTHTLPHSPERTAALARRVLGTSASADLFLTRLDTCMNRVQSIFSRWIEAWSAVP